MITTINEFKKYLTENSEFSQSGMHGEDDFISSITSSIEKKYPDLINTKNWTELKIKIEEDWPSLDSNLVIKHFSGENNHQFKIGDRIMIMGMEPGTKFCESEYYGTIVTIDYEKGIANIQYDDKAQGELIEEEIENLTLESDYKLKSTNENLDYYKELVAADRKRLKNATGAEAELIQQNLTFNLKKLNALKRKPQTTTQPKPAIKPEIYKVGDKVEIYQDGYWNTAKVLNCYDTTDFKNPIEINMAIQGQDHSLKVQLLHDKSIEEYSVDGMVGQWNRRLKKS